MVPMVILSDPPVTSGEEAARLGKVVVMIDGQVHGDEPAGAEAALEILRDAALGDLRYLLDRIVLLVVPRLNPDGSSRSVRWSSHHYDMNRDYLKLDSVEIAALIQKVVVPFSPHVVIDAHEARSRAYDLLLETAHHPNVPKALSDLGENGLSPFVRKELEKKGWTIGRYFRFVDSGKPEAGITSASFDATHNRNYLALQGAVSLLLETSVRKGVSDLEKRVARQRAAMRAALEYTYSHWQEIREASGRPAPAEDLVLRQKTVPSDREEEYRLLEKTGRQEADGNKVTTLKTKPVDKLVPTLTIKRPFAYLVEGECAFLAQKLRKHGIWVERLIAPAEAEIEKFRITGVNPSSAPEHGHFRVLVDSQVHKELREFPQDTFVVYAGQPRGSLAVTLLEPQSADSLVTYNAMDSFLRKGEYLPIYRVSKPVELKTVLVDF